MFIPGCFVPSETKILMLKKDYICDIGPKELCCFG